MFNKKKVQGLLLMKFGLVVIGALATLAALEYLQIFSIGLASVTIFNLSMIVIGSMLIGLMLLLLGFQQYHRGSREVKLLHDNLSSATHNQAVRLVPKLPTHAAQEPPPSPLFFGRRMRLGHSDSEIVLSDEEMEALLRQTHAIEEWHRDAHQHHYDVSPVVSSPPKETAGSGEHLHLELRVATSHRRWRL